MTNKQPPTIKEIEKEFWDDFWIAHDRKGEKLGELIAAFYCDRIEEILKGLEMYKTGYIQHMHSRKAWHEGNGYDRAVKELNAKIKEIRGGR